MSEQATMIDQGPLNVADLEKGAKERTGLADYGDPTYRIGLEKLVDAIEDMNPPVALRETARLRINAILETRLHLVEDARLHPEIVQAGIKRPTIVTGLPRSGTTITYDLLALDPAVRTPSEWEWFMPWPAPDIETYKTDPRIDMIQAMFKVWLDHSPELATVQRFDCTQPGECNHGMTHHFAGSNFWAEWSVPKHTTWMLTESTPGLYDTHKRLLQEMQWKGPKGRWTLKSPSHMFELEPLLDVYPDACIVWTHRDPVLTLSSMSSMTSKFQRAVGLGKDLKAVGRDVMRVWTAAVARGTKARENPRVNAAILDLGHREIVQDPEAALRRIYKHFDLPFSDEHARRIADFMANSKSAQRMGQHKHNPEEYGIDPDEVHDVLKDYYAKFGHLLAKA